MRYYIADNHFFHKSVAGGMDGRKFNDTEEMNEYMINQWNSRVHKNDEVVVLGDLSFGNVEQTNELLERLKGKLYLIRGNHDRYVDKKEFSLSRFEWIKEYSECNAGNTGRCKVILCHYPIIMYRGQYKRKHNSSDSYVYMLHGHIHDTTDNKLLDKFKYETRNTYVSEFDGEHRTIPCNLINCFCGFSDYIPLTLEEWIEVDKKRMEQYDWGE